MMKKKKKKKKNQFEINDCYLVPWYLKMMTMLFYVDLYYILPRFPLGLLCYAPIFNYYDVHKPIRCG